MGSYKHWEKLEKNAGLLAVRMLAMSDPELQQRVLAWQAELAASVEAKAHNLEQAGYENYLKGMGS